MVSLFVHFCKEPGCNCWLGRWWSFFMVLLLCEGGYCVFFEDLLLSFCPFLCVCCCYVPSVFEWCRCLCISVRNPGCNCWLGRWWSFFMVLLLCEGGYCVFFEDLLLPFCPFVCVCCCYDPSVFEWCRCLCISVRKPVCNCWLGRWWSFFVVCHYCVRGGIVCFLRICCCHFVHLCAFAVVMFLLSLNGVAVCAFL